MLFKRAYLKLQYSDRVLDPVLFRFPITLPPSWQHISRNPSGSYQTSPVLLPPLISYAHFIKYPKLDGISTSRSGHTGSAPAALMTL